MLYVPNEEEPCSDAVHSSYEYCGIHVVDEKGCNQSRVFLLPKVANAPAHGLVEGNNTTNLNSVVVVHGLKHPGLVSCAT